MSELYRSLEESIHYLSTSEAQESIKRDPYWPKWDSPWWHMSVLKEMGLADRIPKPAVDTMVQVLKNHYLPVLPLEMGRSR